MSDADIHAVAPPPSRSSSPSAAPPRRRLWPWVLGGLALLLTVLALVGASALLGLIEASREGLQITINGQPWSTLHTDPELSAFGAVGVAAAVVTVLLVLPVVLMLVLLAVALAVGLALVAVVGTVLLAAGCVLLGVALVLSPLWGGALLLWLLLRKPRRAAPSPAGVAAGTG